MFKQYLILFTCLITLSSCTGVPQGVTVVQHVDANRYLGTWYEIARLDHSFERGLQKVTANYSLSDVGSIRVVNQGFNPEEKAWERADGKAYFIEPANNNNLRSGRLKVSFFGPFYSSYNIIDLHQQYQYAVVCGPSKSYFWVLSRTPTMDKALLEELVNHAKSQGFDTEDLIYVKH
jgi:apolipoprotein D and lipocalin family protein